MVIGLNIGVLGLFSLESVTMAELFGSRTRFTQLALAKEIGGILATAIGPVRRRDPHGRDRQLVADRRDARRLLADHPRLRLRSLPRPVGATWSGWRTRYEGRGGARRQRPAGRRAPRPGARRGRGTDRDGVGRDLRIGPRLLAARLVRHRGADAARWCSGTRSPAGSPRSAPASPASRSGSRSRSTRPSWSATGCLPERIAGRTNLYPRIRYFGSAAFDPHTDGGFSELRVVRADQIRPLPEA